MEQPEFRIAKSEAGDEGVTYDCGCMCEPLAAPDAEGTPGFEHCCCGKVHFVGDGASAALTSYLAERKATKKREPAYAVGAATTPLAGKDIEVAWAFPES